MCTDLYLLWPMSVAGFFAIPLLLLHLAGLVLRRFGTELDIPRR